MEAQAVLKAGDGHSFKGYRGDRHGTRVRRPYCSAAVLRSQFSHEKPDFLSCGTMVGGHRSDGFPSRGLHTSDAFILWANEVQANAVIPLWMFSSDKRMDMFDTHLHCLNSKAAMSLKYSFMSSRVIILQSLCIVTGGRRRLRSWPRLDRS